MPKQAIQWTETVSHRGMSVRGSLEAPNSHVTQATKVSIKYILHKIKEPSRPERLQLPSITHVNWTSGPYGINYNPWEQITAWKVTESAWDGPGEVGFPKSKDQDRDLCATDL